jgi:hypothetical protein
MFELKILTDLSTMPKRVETNIDEVEPIIKEAIARVDGLVVTDKREDIIAADGDAAKLTKMAKAIQRFRIDHIALWKEPMEAFETKCKDAEKRLTEAADTLRTKTSEVKDMWRAKKRDLCAGVWERKLAEAFKDEDVLGSEAAKAFFALWTNPKTKGTWVNSSVDIREVEEAMDAEIERMKGVLQTVAANYENADDDVKMKARKVALATFDVNAVIAEVNAWVKERDEMEKVKAALAAKREAQAATASSAASAPVPTPTPTPEAVTTPPTAPQNNAPAEPVSGASDEIETYNLQITGNRKALIALRQYGEKIGITFKKI